MEIFANSNIFLSIFIGICVFLLFLQRVKNFSGLTAQKIVTKNKNCVLSSGWLVINGLLNKMTVILRLDNETEILWAIIL